MQTESFRTRGGHYWWLVGGLEKRGSVLVGQILVHSHLLNWRNKLTRLQIFGTVGWRVHGEAGRLK
jgi:hypothetical protein